MRKIKSVLFVCTGNSCRSIMAEALLKERLKELGRDDVEVRSAGIRALEGLFPTPETIMAMKEEGADVEEFSAKNITDEMIRSSDLILVMEDLHREEIISRFPAAASKTHLLKMFGRDPGENHPEGSDIPDPIGRPLKDYKYCAGVIKKEIERIVKLL